MGNFYDSYYLRFGRKYINFAVGYGMSPQRVRTYLLDRLQLPQPEQLMQWEDDGGARG